MTKNIRKMERGGRPKKRGKTQQIKNEKVREELVSSSSGSSDEPPRSSSTRSLGAPMMVTRCQTRQAKALADKQGASKTPSRVLTHDDGGNSSKVSTLSLVKHVLFGKNKLDTESTVPAEAARVSKSPVHDQDLHSNLENTSPDKDIGAQDGRTVSSDQENGTQDGKTGSSDKGNQPGRNVMDLKKFISDLLAQAQQIGILEAGPTSSEEIMVDNNLPEREANAVPNLFPTVPFADNKSSENNEPTSYHRNPFVDVNGYKVKRKLAPLLSAIFKKHGDIANKSTFSTESRSCLLELVCSIYKSLEASTFVHLPPSDIKSMLDQIRDLELVKVEVGWLRKRLEEISKAREIFDCASTIEDVKEKTVLVISEKRKAVETYEKELEAGMDAVKKLQGTLQQEKDELALALTVADEIEQLYGGSMVHGLV